MSLNGPLECCIFILEFSLAIGFGNW